MHGALHSGSFETKAVGYDDLELTITFLETDPPPQAERNGICPVLDGVFKILFQML